MAIENNNQSGELGMYYPYETGGPDCSIITMYTMVDPVHNTFHTNTNSLKKYIIHYVDTDIVNPDMDHLTRKDYSDGSWQWVLTYQVKYKVLIKKYFDVKCFLCHCSKKPT